MWLSLGRHRHRHRLLQQQAARSLVQCLSVSVGAGVVKSSSKHGQHLTLLTMREKERERGELKGSWVSSFSFGFPWRICHMQTVINHPVCSASSAASSSSSPSSASMGHVNFRSQAHAPADLCTSLAGASGAFIVLFSATDAKSHRRDLSSSALERES